MTLPDVDSTTTYGGELFDYTASVDPTTDRPAAGANPAYTSVAMMTHTVPRALARFSPQGSGTPILAAAGFQWDAVWKAATGTAPVLAHTGTGTHTITFPTTVNDEIAAGQPGYLAAGHTVNFRMAMPSVEPGSTTLWQVSAVVTSPNVITVTTWSPNAGSPIKADVNDGTVIDLEIF